MNDYEEKAGLNVLNPTKALRRAAPDSVLAVTIEASRALSYGLQGGLLESRLLAGITPIEKAGLPVHIGTVDPVAQHEESSEDDLGPLIGEPFELEEDDEAWANPRIVSNMAELFNKLSALNARPARMPTTIENADVHNRVWMTRLPETSLSQLKKHPRMMRVSDTLNSLYAISSLRRRLRTAGIAAKLDTWVLLDSQGRPIELVVRVQPCYYPRPMVVSMGSDGTQRALHEQISVWTPEEAVAVKAVKFGRIAYLVLYGMGKVSFDGRFLPRYKRALNNNGLMATQGTHLGLVNLDSSHKLWMPRTVECLSGAVESLRKVDFKSTYAMYRLFTDPTVFYGGVF